MPRYNVTTTHGSFELTAEERSRDRHGNVHFYNDSENVGEVDADKFVGVRVVG